MCSCDFDEPAVCVVETRKAAKNHACDECDRGIHKGDLYQHTFSVWEGSPNVHKMCDTCATIVKLASALHDGPFCWGIGELYAEIRECFPELFWEPEEEDEAA